MPLPIVVPPLVWTGAKVIASWVAVNTGFAVAGATKAAVENRRKEVEKDPTKLTFKERMTGRVEPETAQKLSTTLVTEEDVTGTAARGLQTSGSSKAH